jgi:preprotein translocase subunit SecG
LFSARVCSKFLTVVALVPVCLLSSATIADLSSAVSLGVDRTFVNLVSLKKTLLKLTMALAVRSRADILAAAVY